MTLRELLQRLAARADDLAHPEVDVTEYLGPSGSSGAPDFDVTPNALHPHEFGSGTPRQPSHASTAERNDSGDDVASPGDGVPPEAWRKDQPEQSTLHPLQPAGSRDFELSAEAPAEIGSSSRRFADVVALLEAQLTEQEQSQTAALDRLENLLRRAFATKDDLARLADRLHDLENAQFLRGRLS